MKITREEFKELVQLYNETWQKFCKYGDIINENLLDELMYPTLNWICERTGLRQENGEIDVLSDLFTFGGEVPVNVKWFELPNGEQDFTCDYTSDLDEIYDYYLKGEVSNGDIPVQS